MSYAFKIDHSIVCIMDGNDPLYLTPEEVRGELDEAEQKQPYDVAWMSCLQDALDALADL